MTDARWEDIATAAYGNDYDTPPRSKVVVVSSRYSGCYEGGLFVAIPIEAMNSDAFGQDTEAANWWYENMSRVGVGATPNEALQDWHQKQQRIDAPATELRHQPRSPGQ